MSHTTTTEMDEVLVPATGGYYGCWMNLVVRMVLIDERMAYADDEIPSCTRLSYVCSLLPTMEHLPVCASSVWIVMLHPGTGALLSRHVMSLSRCLALYHWPVPLRIYCLLSGVVYYQGSLQSFEVNDRLARIDRRCYSVCRWNSCADPRALSAWPILDDLAMLPGSSEAPAG